MNFRSSFSFALRLVFPKTEKKSSARKSMIGAMISIAVSIVPLVTVLSMSEGMIGGMTERLIGLTSGTVTASILPSSNAFDNLEELEAYRDEIQSVSHVESAWPEIDVQSLAVGKSLRTGAFVRGVENDLFSKNKYFASFIQVKEGNLCDFGKNQKECVLGEEIARKLSLHPGDSFRLVTTSSGDAGQGSSIRPKMTSLKVLAVVSSGYQEIDSLWIFVPIREVSLFASKTSRTTELLINLDNTFSPSHHFVMEEMSKIRPGNAMMNSWEVIHASRLQRFSSTKLLLVLVMLLIVLVASVNISSALVMLSMERRKEIGILKSIGASNGFITFSFLIAGLFTSLIGIVLGLPFGIFISVFINQIIYGIEWILNILAIIPSLFHFGNSGKIVLMDPAFYLSSVPIVIPFDEIFLICIGILLLSSVVSIIPAIKAGKEKPLDIIRKG